MAELICRALRDGALEGEHAPALAIKDSIDSPFGSDVFNHVLSQLCSNVLAGKSQSKGVVLVALSRSPSLYVNLLKSRVDTVASFDEWLRVLDCYTDPLGWKDRLKESGSITNLTPEVSHKVRLCKDATDLDALFSSIIELGKEAVGHGKGRFSVAIDSVTEMLRRSSISSVAALLSSLRSHVMVTSVLEYMCSMLANIEPTARSANGQRGYLPLLEQNSRRGKFHVRLKRRNGRVKLMTEDFSIEPSGIKFTLVSCDGGTITQSLVPKVQFNLQLSETERIERAKVVLPFEHQGTGKPIDIYDGRQSLDKSKFETNSTSLEKLQMNEDIGKGEIIYFRDSDDEKADSDEDPDDDLDI